MPGRRSVALFLLTLTPGLARADDATPLVVEPAAPTPELPHPCEGRPLGRWWAGVSAELAWASTRPAPQQLRLRPPGVFGGAGTLDIPLGGRLTGPFQPGLGVAAGCRFADDHAVEFGLLLLPGSSRTVDGVAPNTLVYFPGGESSSAPVIAAWPGTAGSFTGSFPATAETLFVGLDLNYRAGLLNGGGGWLDLLAGYRFAYLQDELFLGRRDDGGGDHRDRDDTDLNRLAVGNAFHGGQLGLAGRVAAGDWYADGTVKLAYGAVRTTGGASGAFRFTDTPVRLPSETRDAFLPSVNVRLGYHLTDRARLYVGYSFLYLSRAGRLGDVLGGRDPSDFWVQSLGLGLDWRF